ncbi:MAG: FmdB family zinc ribbon protein, partial [Planctomycetota bacterium]
ELKLRRLIGPGAGVIFKGSGFYQTDYRTDSYKKAADAEKKAAESKPKDKKKDAKKPKADKPAKKPSSD